MTTEELESKITTLEKVSEEKTGMMAIGAHELRTLLTSQKWIMQMLIDGDVGPLSIEQKNLLGKSSESVERMLAVVNDMLICGHNADLSTTKHEKKPEDMVALLDSVLFNFMSESYKKGIELLFLKPTTPVAPIAINRTSIQVILQNLIENAIKYSSKGDRIFISVSDAGTMLRISVKDTGIGISTADQEKIFNKFFRAKNAEAHEAIGTGLGLYTSKMVAEAEGGSLTFTSIEKINEEGEHGTTFFLDLPKN
jgi:two-component system, OmpR family, phosphate regulon sensor histidine kinase PhoR